MSVNKDVLDRLISMELLTREMYMWWVWGSLQNFGEVISGSRIGGYVAYKRHSLGSHGYLGVLKDGGGRERPNMSNKWRLAQ